MIQSLVLMVSLTALASAQTLDPPPFQVMPQPGAVVDYYNQHSGTTLTGDTPAYTMWLPTGSFSYVPPGGVQIQVRGSVFGMYADGTDPASVNFAIVRLVKLDFANPKNTQIQLVNAMAGYGTNAARDVPKGWNGQYTAGAGNDANWKASNGWSMDGHLFLPVHRQTTNFPFYTGFDTTIIRSDDAGAHWCNPYTLSLTPDGHCPTTSSEFSASGLSSYGYTLQRLADGDAPLPPSDASYSASPSSMLFHVASLEAGMDVSPILTCQDESIANGVLTCPTGDGHDRYLYLFALDGNRKMRRLARILKSKLETRYGASDFSVYTCPSYWSSGPCDGSLDASWSANLADATIVQFDQGTFGRLHSLSSAVSVPTDLAGTRSYVLVGKNCRMGGPCFAAAMTSPKPWGPWTLSALAPPPDDDYFYYPILATYRLLGDGHFGMAIAASARIAFPREGSPYFYHYDFTANRIARNQPAEAVAIPMRGRPATAGHLKLRYCTGAGETACIPISGLVSAIEFSEPEGFDWTNPYAGAQQWFPRPHATNVVGDAVCIVTGGHDSNRQWQGTNTVGTRGWGMMFNSLYYGFRDKCVLYDGKGPDTITAINTHSTPAPLTGDQDWTVVTVFKVSNTTANGIYSWSSLNCAPGNYPPCTSAGGGGGVYATASANLTDLTGQGKGNGSLGLMFDVAGGSLLNCCVGLATAADQQAPEKVYAVAYVKRAGALTPANLNAASPVVKIWRGSDPYAGAALTLYGGNNGGPPRTSANNYFYFGWADSTGNSSVAGRHADVTYYYNLIYSRALSDAEWLRLYTYFKSALPDSPAGVVVQ